MESPVSLALSRCHVIPIPFEKAVNMEEARKWDMSKPLTAQPPLPQGERRRYKGKDGGTPPYPGRGNPAPLCIMNGDTPIPPAGRSLHPLRKEERKMGDTPKPSAG